MTIASTPSAAELQAAIDETRPAAEQFQAIQASNNACHFALDSPYPGLAAERDTGTLDR